MNALKANKFKVGDKVQVIKDNCTEGWFTVEYQYIDGVVVQVNPKEKEDRYYVKIKDFEGIYDDGCFAFNDEHLRLIEAFETVSEQDKTGSKPYNPLKANKFKVGDEVEIVKLDKTIEHFGGELVLKPVGTKVFVTWVDVTGEEVEIDADIYSYHADDLTLIKSTLVEKQTHNSLVTQEGIKSDGGSSDYYFTKLPQELIVQIVKTGGIEIKDIARYVYDNNADAFNIIKAQKRIIEANKGVGKVGITKLYDANKIVYFANEQLKAIKREGTDK